MKERQFYTGGILTPQHQHYAEIDGHDPFIAMTMMKKKEKDEEEGDEHQCDRSSQDDDIRVPSEHV